MAKRKKAAQPKDDPPGPIVPEFPVPVRQALVRQTDGYVANVIIGGDTSYTIPEGYAVSDTDTANPGWAYDGGDFTPPPGGGDSGGGGGGGGEG